MTAWDIGSARRALGGLRLNGGNIEVAERWFDLWHDDRPPTLGELDAHPLPSHVPGMAVFRVRRATSIFCIRAGEYWRLATGFDMTGQSLLALTNNVDREDRLDWCWRIVEGAATVSYRAFRSVRGTAHAQGLSLPLADRCEDGTRFFVTHSNWRPQGTDWIEGNVSGDLQTPPERAMRSFASASAEVSAESRAGLF